ncbi:MAG: deoxyguanosinetriphosphate triphosphohydrolase [Planctomycetes bacterium]|nr:deoxyguanosinetriphosphate triphosphohydrolase [Planctomycetota bacterium]
MLRSEFEEREYDLLAPYAVKSAESAGRKFDEPEAAYRTCFQRDRDRIIHCKAFRRLEYKTQVFLNHEGDHYRTRLTHTIEVAQISRTISRTLRLNEDLTEAIALAHDLGHTPFGHSGEDVLRELMAEHGGFEHNAQGLRVVDLLENQYPAFPGLNLTEEVREAIAKHTTRWDNPEIKQFGAGAAVLEAQVVEISDSIAYDNHDLQDGFEAGILRPEKLSETDLWQEAVREVENRYGRLDEVQLPRQAVRYLIGLFVTDVIENTRKRLEAGEIRSWQDVRAQKDRLVGFSEQLKRRKDQLEQFLLEHLYRDYRVVRVTSSARRFIRCLFDAYTQEPTQLPPEYRKWADKVGLERAVCDYIAGMTDRYAQDHYTQLFEPYQKL